MRVTKLNRWLTKGRHHPVRMFWYIEILFNYCTASRVFKLLDISLQFCLVKRSFHICIVSLCSSNGCRVVVYWTLKLIMSSRSWPRAACARFDSRWAAEFFSNIKLWQLITLQTFNPQRPTIPLWKDLNLFCWHKLCPKD